MDRLGCSSRVFLIIIIFSLFLPFSLPYFGSPCLKSVAWVTRPVKRVLRCGGSARELSPEESTLMIEHHEVGNDIR